MSAIFLFSRGVSYLSRSLGLLSGSNLRSYLSDSNADELKPDILFVETTGREIDFWEDGLSVQAKAYLWHKKAELERIPSRLLLAPLQALNAGKLSRTKATPMDGALIPALVRFFSDPSFRRVSGQAFGLLVEAWSTYPPLARVRLGLETLITLEVLFKFRPKVMMSIGMDVSNLIPCSILGIQAVELSHGLGSGNDTSFLYGLRHYLSSEAAQQFPMTPQYFGQTPSDTINAQQTGIEALHAGYPYNFEGVSIYSARQSEVRLLISLSWNASDAVDPWGAISIPMDNFLRRIIASNCCAFRIRLHPRFEAGREYNALRNHLIARFPTLSEVSFSSSSLIYDLGWATLMAVDSSSAVVEAAHMSVPSIWLSEELRPPTDLENLGYILSFDYFDADWGDKLERVIPRIPRLVNQFDVFSLRDWMKFRVNRELEARTVRPT